MEPTIDVVKAKKFVAHAIWFYADHVGMDNLKAYLDWIRREVDRVEKVFIKEADE